MDLEPGVINAARASPLGEFFRTGNLVNTKIIIDRTRPHPVAFARRPQHDTLEW
jgi:hypothetical protein